MFQPWRSKEAGGSSLRRFLQNLISASAALIAFASLNLPSAFGQSPEASAEWALFNQILLIGIATGLVVFGIMFYAIVRYRERPERKSEK